MPAAPVQLDLDLNPTLGAVFVGFVFSAVLFGITLLQTIYYYTTFRDDRLWDKLMVAGLTILDTGHFICAAHAVYWYTILHYGQPLYLNVIVWSLTADVFFTSIIAFIVQLYLTRRVWILSEKNYIVSGFLTVLCLFALASGLAYGIRLGQLGLQSSMHLILYLIRMALGGTVAADICITLALVYYLRRSRTGVKSTHDLVHFLVIFAINTGAITSLFALLDVIIHATLEKTLGFMAFYVCLSKLYVNSLLGTLNARSYLRQHNASTNVNSDSHKLSTFQTNSNRMGMSTDYTTTTQTQSIPGPMMFSDPPRSHSIELNDNEKPSRLV
ncbi:hypothetical protein PENSPDRAFT_652577 [Peniophora sp. CONT]|nr:hypothetical protein PENSPDRAFT_652577 [Peniophora sp. CONT]